MVCNNMNIAFVIGAGITMPAGVNSSNVFLNLGFLNNRLDINIENKILKQNEEMPRLQFMYVFNQATGYTSAKNGYYFTSANFEDNIWPSHKFKPQKITAEKTVNHLWWRPRRTATVLER